MGNRAVIALKDNAEAGFAGDDIGIYLHWNGSPDQVEEYLKIARARMDDRMGDIEYSKARLVGIIHDEIGGNLSLGLDLCKYLDTDNGNNGTYVVNMKTLRITEQLGGF